LITQQGHILDWEVTLPVRVRNDNERENLKQKETEKEK